jgi:hypothetical protein
MTDLETPEYETIYIAGSIREAERVEEVFAEEGIEYRVVPCEFANTISLSGPYAGVSFGVLAGQASYCRHALAQRGFNKGIVCDS